MAKLTGRVKCAYFGCTETTTQPHNLCAIHWLMRFDRALVKCPDCGVYRYREEHICENCEEAKKRTTRTRQFRPNTGKSLPARHKA